MERFQDDYTRDHDGCHHTNSNEAVSRVEITAGVARVPRPNAVQGDDEDATDDNQVGIPVTCLQLSISHSVQDQKPI